MSMSDVYNEIRQSINSGEIYKLPKEKLEQFSTALARSQAHSHYSKSEFPQICETVRALLIQRTNTEQLSELFAQSTDENKDRIAWYNKALGRIALGVIVVLLGAIVIWLINHYLHVGL